MISNFLRLILFVVLPVSVSAQSLQVTVNAETSGNETSTFELKNDAITISSNNIFFNRSGNRVSDFDVVGISSDLSNVAWLSRNGQKGMAVLSNSRGDTLNAFTTTSLAADDPSIAIYPANNGDILIRDNITNFTFYNTFGELETSMSSSSQSKEGEVISEVSMSEDGSTLVIYNPKIRRNGQLGSQAQIMTADKGFENIYFSTGRYLKDVSVSDDGSVILAISSKDGRSDDEVLIMDRFGNELNTISSDEDLIGANLSEDAQYLTIYSSGRVQVYKTVTGEQIGSASVRSPLFMAAYFPKDSIVLGVSGSYSADSGILSSVEFHAINLEKRSIARESLNSRLGFQDIIKPKILRTTTNSYRLLGANKHIDINVSF